MALADRVVDRGEQLLVVDRLAQVGLRAAGDETDELFFNLFPTPAGDQQTLFNVAPIEDIVPNEAVAGVRVGRFTIGGPKAPTESQDADDALHVRVPVKAGSRQVVATIVKTDGARPEGLGPEQREIITGAFDITF